MNCSFSLLCSLLFTVILRMTLLSGVFARSSLFLKKRYWICTIILSAALFLIAYLSLIHGRSDDDLVVFVLQTGSVFAFFMAVLEGEWTHSIFYTILFLTLENSAGILSDVVFNDSDLVLYGNGSLISDLCKWFIELIRYGMPYALMYQLEIHICGVSLARKAKGTKMACLLAGILLFVQMEIAELCSSIFLNITFREIWKTALLPGFLIALLPGIHLVYLP